MSDIFIDESVILLDMEEKTSEQVLTKMGKNLLEKNLVKESFIQAIIDRENEYATGLPTGSICVAIPHTDVEHVNRKNISVGILKDNVEFGMMGADEETVAVKVVFMLAMDKADAQLTLLRKLMKVFQNEKTLQFIVEQTDKSKIKELLEKQLELSKNEGGNES